MIEFINSYILPSQEIAITIAVLAIFLFAGIVKGFLGIGLPAAAMAFLTLVKIIGRVSKEMAIVGSIIKVRNAIAAAGRPMPKKPLMIPAKRKIAITAMVMAISCDGRM